MNKKKKEFQLEYLFKNIPVLFEHKENLMVNATKLAKHYNKLAKDYLMLNRTKALIKEIRNCLVGEENSPHQQDNYDMVYTVDKHKGTYMHRLLALDFAGWLNPKFQVWMLQKTEYILFGYAQKQNKEIIDNAERIKRLEELEAKFKDNKDMQEIKSLRMEINQGKRRITKSIKQQTKMLLSEN